MGIVEKDREVWRNGKKVLKAIQEEKEKFKIEKESLDWNKTENQHEHQQILP